MNVNFSQTVLPIFIFLTLLVRKGFSIQCYECNSHENVMCNNPKDHAVGAVPIVDCGEATMCRKIEQHIEINGDSQVRIHRECAMTGGLGDCLERTGTNKFKSWYCNCDNEDLCNSGSFTSFSLVVTCAALFSAFLLRKML